MFVLQQLGEGAHLGRTMWGMLGLGAFGFQLQEVPGDRRIVTTTRSHSNKLVLDCVDAMEPHEVIRVGGAGNKVRRTVKIEDCTETTEFLCATQIPIVSLSSAANLLQNVTNAKLNAP